MRRCRINLPNRCHHLISRVARRAFEFEGLQAANRKDRYDKEKLLWQSTVAIKSDPVGFRLAWQSVQSNAVPVFVLWLFAVVLIVSYRCVPAVANALEPLSRWQTESGWVAAFLNRVVFCGLLPGVFLVAVPSLRLRKVGWVVLAYSLWAGVWGILCDGFFTLQTWLFGSGHDAVTIIKKTLVDQLVWNVAICNPANAVFFPWVASGFSRLGRVRDNFLPMLISNWIVWWPVMAVVYLFPLPLQIQVVGLVGALWMLVALRSGRR